MRKYKKQELLNCIKTLKEAHKKIEYAEDSVRNEILFQCQEMAIQVGMEIDRVEGEGTCAVSYLEEYCEAVYQTVVSTDTKRVLQKNAERLLDQIADSIRTDIPTSPAEIVFLPYKASMWDALDSVYRASIEEKDCHVIVMPIPYFNIDSKGKVLAVEYEGNQFPDDIPITDFSKINLAQLHPDVIFIHNPYDEWNRVTQVPQEYFSATLVNHTEHLVYIPYFVTKGDKIKDDYCYLPAVRNAWRTFVQSEAVRDCYIKNGAESSKIVAMGSPKFDMVIRMQENPPAMPEEWKAALAGRKVFLLNTHLNPIINEAEKTIDKLRQIFQLFAERDDAALLWRPHPLSIQTAKSMNPRILESYMQLVGEFKTLQNGIYDMTPDVHRAIAISNAYIGHGSSLVAMYGITGKPMYMLSADGEANVRIAEEEKYLNFECGVEYHNALWVSAKDHNGVYRIDLETKKAEWIIHFEKEAWCGKELYREAVLYEDTICFIPYRADFLTFFHIPTRTMKYCKLEYGEDNVMYKFVGGEVYKDKLYLFPARAAYIVCYDLESEKVQYIRNCCEELEKMQELYVTFLGCVRVEERIYAVSRKGNCFVELDVEKQNYIIHYLKTSSAALMDIAETEGNLYLLTVRGEVIQWNILQKTEKIIWNFADHIRTEGKKHYTGEFTDVPYSKIRIVCNQIFVFPYLEQEIVQIDLLDKDKICFIEFPSTYKIWNNGNCKAKEVIVRGEKILICPANANEMLQVNCMVKKSEISELIIRNEDSKYIGYNNRSASAGKKNVLYMEKEWKVENFVNIVTESMDENNELRKRKFRDSQLGMNGKCGEAIWKYVKEAE